VTDTREAKAAVERGRPVLIIAPPSARRAIALWSVLPPAGRTVIVSAGPDAALEWISAAPAGRRVHAVTGLGRSARLLQTPSVDVVAGAAKDLSALVTRSALKLDGVAAVVVAWPEGMSPEHADTLDALLAECKTAQRVVLAWNPGSLGDFLERHARRAETVGRLPLDENGSPLPPAGTAQYVVVSHLQRDLAEHQVLDALDRPRVVVWRAGDASPTEPQDAVVCADLPTRDELVTLREHGEPVVLLTAAQLPYLRSIASPLRALNLSTVADRARDRAETLRVRVAQLLEQQGVDGELALLEPLFERFDPAEVAAALLALGGEPGAGSREPQVSAHGSRLPAPSWVKIFVNVGKKDRAQPKDIVGALTKEVKLARDAIGKVDLRDTFSLIEVAADQAEAVVRGFTGVTVKGRRVVARFERR
jgi:DbpA-like RNA binding protein